MGKKTCWLQSLSSACDTGLLARQLSYRVGQRHEWKEKMSESVDFPNFESNTPTPPPPQTLDKNRYKWSPEKKRDKGSSRWCAGERRARMTRSRGFTQGNPSLLQESGRVVSGLTWSLEGKKKGGGDTKQHYFGRLSEWWINGCKSTNATIYIKYEKTGALHCTSV